MRWTLRLWLLLVTLASPSFAGDGFDYYINYLQGQDWPDQHTPVYAEDVQGIAHDDDHWFITKQGAHGTVLYKIHVSENLAAPSITASTTPAASGLTASGFDKFKAMDSYENPADRKWYVVIAVEGSSGAGIAVYTDGLVLIGSSSLSPQTAAGWCAIDNEGSIYSGENNTSHLNRFTLDWASLASSGTVSVSFSGTVQLLDESLAPLSMTQYQGGDFTPEGDKIYIVTGFYGVSNGPHGIHVFDATPTGSWRRLLKSGQSGMFAYQFNPSCGVVCEEPEGLTFWDLNDGRCPNVRGELHVLMLDNDYPDDDDVYIKHYSEGIWVDGSHSGSSNGDPATPDVTVADGLARVVDGLELRIHSGSYPETMTISKKVKLVKASGSGSVVIGAQ